MTAITTYAPAAGFLGLALYQAINQHDFASAAHTVGQALTLFGVGSIGTLLLGLHSKVDQAAGTAPPK